MHDPNVLKKMQEVDRSRQISELSKRILSTVNNACMGEQTLSWLQNVNENVALPQTGQSTPGQPYAMTMVAIMDKLFDDFQRYSFQFNRAEPNRNYVVTCQRPAALNQREASSRYEGVVQNSLWAMLVQGEAKSITAKFVNTQFVYVDESRRPVVMPFFQIECADAPGTWAINGKKMSPEHVPIISKLMFARLIRVSRGEANERDLLTVNLEQSPSPEETAETNDVHRSELITESLMTLIETIDLELKDLESAGMIAMRSANKETMQNVMTRSSEMMEMRASVAELAKKWAVVLSRK